MIGTKCESTVVYKQVLYGEKKEKFERCRQKNELNRFACRQPLIYGHYFALFSSHFIVKDEENCRRIDIDCAGEIAKKTGEGVKSYTSSNNHNLMFAELTSQILCWIIFYSIF